MLSFDVSAIDIVLLVVMLILLLLFIAQRRSQPMAESQLSINPHEKLLEQPEAKEEIRIEDRLGKQSDESFGGCAHQFGHLRSLPGNARVPDECFGCPKVLRCMFRNE